VGFRKYAQSPSSAFRGFACALHAAPSWPCDMLAKRLLADGSRPGTLKDHVVGSKTATLRCRLFGSLHPVATSSADCGSSFVWSVGHAASCNRCLRQHTARRGRVEPVPPFQLVIQSVTKTKSFRDEYAQDRRRTFTRMRRRSRPEDVFVAPFSAMQEAGAQEAGWPTKPIHSSSAPPCGAIDFMPARSGEVMQRNAGQQSCRKTAPAPGAPSAWTRPMKSGALRLQRC